MLCLRRSDRLPADSSQISRDFIGQHLLQAKSEEMRSVPAIRTSSDVATRSCRSTRTAVTGGTTIRKTGANAVVRVDITGAIAVIRTLSLRACERAVKDLASGANRGEWMVVDEKKRKIRLHYIASTGANLVCKIFIDSGFGCVRRKSFANRLCSRRWSEAHN